MFNIFYIAAVVITFGCIVYLLRRAGKELPKYEGSYKVGSGTTEGFLMGRALRAILAPAKQTTDTKEVVHAARTAGYNNVQLAKHCYGLHFKR